VGKRLLIEQLNLSLKPYMLFIHLFKNVPIRKDTKGPAHGASMMVEWQPEIFDDSLFLLGWSPRHIEWHKAIFALTHFGASAWSHFPPFLTSSITCCLTSSHPMRNFLQMTWLWLVATTIWDTPLLCPAPAKTCISFYWFIGFALVPPYP
jgi:hypothetical protein